MKRDPRTKGRLRVRLLSEAKKPRRPRKSTGQARRRERSVHYPEGHSRAGGATELGIASSSHREPPKKKKKPKGKKQEKKGE